MAIEGYSAAAAEKAYRASLEREIAPEVRQTARNLVGAFALQKDEDFYVITDGDVVRVFPEMVRAVDEEARAVLAMNKGKGRLKLMVATPAEHSAVSFEDTIGGYLDAPGHKAVLLLTRMSRSWAPQTQAAIHAGRGLKDMIQRRGETFDEAKLQKVAARRNARIISITKAADREVLTSGAILEPLPEIRERSRKIAELMRNVVRAHLTNDAGTDLLLELRPEYSAAETGEVDKPGMISNFPVGEWYVLPRQKGTSGKLVIHDAPMGGAIRREMMSGKTVAMDVCDGKLTAINDIHGEGPAAKLREYLEAGRNADDVEHGDPLRIAEFAIGANTKAWREVNGKREVASTSVEGEKAYGTVHVAFGANGIYGQPADDAELTNVQTHADCIVLKPTVECFREDGTSFFIIREGEPQGY